LRKFADPTPYLNKQPRSDLAVKALTNFDQLHKDQLRFIFNKIEQEYLEFQTNENKVRAKKIEIGLTLRKKIDSFKKIIQDMGKTNFKTLCGTKKNDRLNVILSFLAILDMTKNNFISLSQKNNFDSIIIENI
jgi:chromatin segregation and condensation protein Rec8/ScpA/Scc1 (kleisin family)